MMADLVPLDLKQVGPNLIGIVWSDSHHAIYPSRDLRLQCPCAQCVDEWTKEPRLDPKTVPLDVKPIRIESVGRYALRVTWSDGHDTGIYTFTNLRAICRCPACKNKASARAAAAGAERPERDRPARA